MVTKRKVTPTNLLIWIAGALLIALVGLYLAEYFGVSFVREVGGRVA